MDIKDLAGLSKPLSKLIETLGNGAGVLYEPTRICRLAKAEKDAALTRAEGDIEVAALAARAGYRVQAREVYRQRNLEAIADRARLELPATVDPKLVEPDWTAEFVDCAQDVSDVTMQSLWARILAGEVTQGGSFSRRTLAAVRVMSKEDAAPRAGRSSRPAYDWRRQSTRTWGGVEGSPARASSHLDLPALLIDRERRSRRPSGRPQKFRATPSASGSAGIEDTDPQTQAPT